MAYDRIVGHDCVLQVAVPATSSMSFITVGGIDADVSEPNEMPVVTVIARGDSLESNYPTKGRKKNLSFTVKPASDNDDGIDAIRTAFLAGTQLVAKVINGPATAGSIYDQYTVVVTKCDKSQPRADVITYSVEFAHSKYPGVSDSFDQTYS